MYVTQRCPASAKVQTDIDDLERVDKELHCSVLIEGGEVLGRGSEETPGSEVNLEWFESSVRLK